MNYLLNSHPSIAILTETSIESTVATMRAALYDHGNVQVELDRRDRLTDFIKAFYRCRFGRDTLTIIGSKMPDVCTDEPVRSIYDAVGPYRRIYIVRRPSEVVASSLTRRDNAAMGLDAWHIKTTEQAIVEWAVNWEHIARASTAEDVLVVSYEAFRREGSTEIDRIAEFLNVGADGFADIFIDAMTNGPALADEDAVMIHGILGAMERGIAADTRAALRDTPEVLIDVPMARTFATTNANPLSRLVLKAGFSTLEDFGSWTCAEEAVVAFKVEARGPVVVTMTLAIFHGRRAAFRLHLQTAGGREVFDYAPDGAAATASISCPVVDGAVRITLRMPERKTPHEHPHFDTRELGVGLLSLRVDEAG